MSSLIFFRFINLFFHTTMRGIFFLVFTLISLVLIFSGCKKDDEECLFVDQASIEFDYDDDDMNITVSNVGSEEFTWTVTGNLNLMEFSKTSGTCAKNSPDKFQIILKRYNIHEDNISESITISASTGESLKIPLLIHGFPEDKVRINADIYDADYDYVHDKLALAWYDNGNAYIGIYDLATATLSRLPFEYSYLGNISFAHDGTYIASSLDYENHVLYIKHLENQVSSSVMLSPSIIEIVSGIGGLVYVFHNYYSSAEEMSILNFTTGGQNNYNLTGSLNIEDAHLHQSGNYIYGVDDYYLNKINISNDAPSVVYSEYISDLNHKIWLSKDGSRIFTDEKRILTINPELAGYDVTEQADLNIWSSYIQGIEQDIIHNEYYVIPSNNYSFNSDSDSQEILVFNNNFEQIKAIQLEDYYFASDSQPYFNLVNPSAEYVFVSSNGNKIIVVSKASDYSNDWGIEVLER